MATVTGGAGKDFIHRLGDGNVAPAGFTDVTGVTTGDDTITGLAGDDSIYADAGNDVIDGGAGADTMRGGAGDDTFYVDNAGDVVVEASGAGTDRVVSSVTYSIAGQSIEALTLTGSTNINATGNTLANTLTGNSGNNTLNGGTGADTMRGGAGDDTFYVDDASDVVVEGSGAGNDQVFSSVSYSVAGQSIERLTLTGSASIDATGNTLANTLTGNSGANVLNGGAGADTMAGGAGNDTYVVDNAGDTVVEAAGGGTDTVQSALSYTLGDNVENLTLTGSANASATGNALANILTGNAGNNVLDGGAGADKMYGGAGDDTFYVDNTGDLAVESSGGGTDLVIASVTYSIAGQSIENLTLAGSANISATGNTLANALVGNAGNNKLNGGTGADTMTGGAGNDTYVVDNAGDTVVEAAGGGTDLVQSALSYTLGSDVENLTLTGSGNINGSGNALANVITGNAGDNTLSGGDGDDTLVGGVGQDDLIGGLGNDRLTVDITDGNTDSADGGANAGDTLVLTGSALYFGSVDVDLTLADQFTDDAVTQTGFNNVDASAVTDIWDGGTFVGNDNANVLIGTAGSDTITGGAGADTVSGGVGDDYLKIYTSADTAAGEIYDGGAGSDTLTDDDTSTVPVIVNSGVTFTGIEDLIGFDYGLTLTAAQLASFSDTIYTGDITLSSAGTIDLSAATVYTTTFNLSDSGNNSLTLDDFFYRTVNGGAGADTVTILDLSANGYSASLYGNGGNDTLSGSAFSDTLDGGAGNDTLAGNAGNDTLTGGAGADTLTGGNDADTYVYNSAADSTGVNYDTVVGFQAAQATMDAFDLVAGVTAVDAPITTGTLSTATFDTNLATAMSGLQANHAVLFTANAGTLSGATFLVVDQNGTAGYQSGADLVIRMNSLSGTLTTGNFF